MSVQTNLSPVLIWMLPYGKGDAQSLELNQAATNLNAACSQLPGGAYTTLRTYHGNRVLRLDEHFSRLEESAALRGETIKLDRITLRRVMRTEVGEEGSGDYRFRLVLDLDSAVGDVYLLREMLVVPTLQEYKSGVEAAISSLKREMPEAKLTSFLAETSRLPPPTGTNEALILDQEMHILEGLSSNFFAVIEREIWTAGEGILAGTTRRIVLNAIKQVRIPIRLQALKTSDIPNMSEAFLTSTSRGVLPLVRIARQRIGSGSPGLITREISGQYQVLIEDNLQPL